MCRRLGYALDLCNFVQVQTKKKSVEALKKSARNYNLS